jgi:hypothetical protein
MAALGPAIHVLFSNKDVDACDKRGHDVERPVQTNERVLSLQRLDTHDLAFVIGVPDCDRVS